MDTVTAPIADPTNPAIVTQATAHGPAAAQVVPSAHGLAEVYRSGEVEVHTLRDFDIEIRRGDFVVPLGLTTYRREHVGFVFQFYNLTPSLKVRENLALVTDIAKDPMPIDDAIKLVGLTPRRDHFLAQLSGCG